MAASQMAPEYTVYIISGTTKYNVTPAVVSLDRTQDKKKIAQTVDVQLKNMKVGGDWLSSLIKARSRVYVYANDGSKNEEVFRGFVWKGTETESLTDDEFSIRGYDNLIYFQESEESTYFSSGKSTKSVLTTLCNNWGVKLDYDYESITHSKLALRGKLSDIITEDILNPVKDRTGKKYVLYSAKDVVTVKGEGSNTTIYHFLSEKNVIQTKSEFTMEDMITKVVIVGKADSNDREPVEATVSGNTSEYGTLQKVISRDSNTSLANAKKEAQTLIKEKGEPKWEYSLQSPDIPWLMIGDKVYVNTGKLIGYFIVTAIERSISNQKNQMTLTLEKP